MELRALTGHLREEKENNRLQNSNVVTGRYTVSQRTEKFGRYFIDQQFSMLYLNKNLRSDFLGWGDTIF